MDAGRGKMTGEKTSSQSLGRIDRSELMEISSWAIRKLHTRLKGQRFRVRDSDTTELKFFRVLIAGISAHAQILKDDALDQIEERLRALEEGR
jgi:hypothetical protein